MKKVTKKVVKITERGWPGHFCAVSQCSFRRNTLVEYGNKRVVVSTVGLMRSSLDGKIETIGWERYYETMAFAAKKEGVYWEANVSKQIPFESPWSLNEKEQESDLKANDMHEAVVAEIARLLSKQ